MLFQVEDTKTGRYAALKLVSLRQAHVGEVYDTAALLRRLHHGPGPRGTGAPAIDWS